MSTYNDEAALRILHDGILCAFNELDLDKLLSLSSDNIVLVEPDMPGITGKTEVIQLFKKFQQQKLVYNLSYKIQQLEVFGKTAFVRAQVVKQVTLNNKAPMQEVGKFITMSQKQDDGRWLIQAIVNNDQSNFSFFDVYFKNSERIKNATAGHDEFAEEDTKDVPEGSPQDLVYRMISSSMSPLHDKPVAGQKF